MKTLQLYNTCTNS